MSITEAELKRREQAFVAGFIEYDGEKAYKYIQDIIGYDAQGGLRYRITIYR